MHHGTGVLPCFPDHLQAAGIQIHLLGQIHLTGNIAVNFSVGSQIAAVKKVQAELSHLNVKLLPTVKKIAKQLHEKYVVIALQHGPAGSLLVSIAGLLLLQAIQCPAGRGAQGILIQLQLDQIVRHLVGQSLLDKKKFFIAGEDNKQREGAHFLSAGLNKLQTVHDGHLNVRDHQLRRVLPDHLKGRLAIHGRSTYLDTKSFPLYHGFDAVLFSKIILDPLVDIHNSHMAEEICLGVCVSLYDLLDGLPAHSHSVVRDEDLKNPLGIFRRDLFCLNQDLSRAALGLDAVEHGIFHNWLQGKAMDPAPVQLLVLLKEETARWRTTVMRMTFLQTDCIMKSICQMQGVWRRRS